MGYYDKMTKQDVINKCEELEARIIQLNETNIRLKDENEKLDSEHDYVDKRCKQLETEIDTYKKREKLFWKVINRILDTEELIGDLEDAAEELKDAFKKSKSEEDDD